MKVKDIKYTHGITKEGLKYILYKNSKTYSVNITVLVRTGSIFDKIPGESHLLEHMILKSSKSSNYTKIQKELEYRGAYRNGTTSYEYNEYYITLPYTELDYGFSYIKDILINALLDNKELNLEKNIIYDEILKNYNDPYEHSYESTLRNYLTKKSLFYNSILGTKQDLEKISTTNLNNFYLHYNTKNIYVSVSGRFDKQTTIEKIDQLSEEIKRSKNSVENKYQDIDIKKPTRLIVNKSNLSKNAIVSLTNISSTYETFGIKSNITSNLLSTILGGTESSYLNQALREKTGYLYSYNLLKYQHNKFGFEGILFESNPKDVEKIIYEIHKTINNVKKDKIKKQELNHFKEFYKNRLLIKNDTHKSISRTLLFDLFNLKKMYTPARLLEYLDKITLQNINGVLQKIIVENYNINIFGKTEGININNLKKTLGN
ncbi:hypothetical protein COV24_04240 [candidate division WWE3 bacterium CG10_big_fil_rev_8_21_14_0_10_32_10]|uniref:Peptidase M16 N-terminal domain-containing protein n=1 Tax=candidate division WWE3 bacterium CG10_big_fil_rev_8_21_14_0_10_32_10 TaxID=1975090 RepID=A0A2H0R9Y2_UNCKA|nr:MAG: hypothetical protein COV24_04240 [candidate division WWE3 bacterium CG10_big_fil_rev_8_21_14_0_10_32_10]